MKQSIKYEIKKIQHKNGQFLFQKKWHIIGIQTFPFRCRLQMSSSKLFTQTSSHEAKSRGKCSSLRTKSGDFHIICIRSSISLRTYTFGLRNATEKNEYSIFGFASTTKHYRFGYCFPIFVSFNFFRCHSVKFISSNFGWVRAQLASVFACIARMYRTERTNCVSTAHIRR